MTNKVMVTADRIKRRQKRAKLVKLSVLLMMLFLIIVYIILKINFHEGSFVVTLESNDSLESGISIFESPYDTVGKRVLKAESLQFMDNISIKWLHLEQPENIDSDEFTGAHNGENYIAYTFYIQNQGEEAINYWYEVVVDDVIKEVDEAARIIIFLNGESTIYAKGSSVDGSPEEGTEVFRLDSDGTIILEQRVGLEPDEIDRMTVVVFIEGDDPECIDSLIGGELRMHMNITEEHIQTK